MNNFSLAYQARNFAYDQGGTRRLRHVSKRYWVLGSGLEALVIQLLSPKYLVATSTCQPRSPPVVCIQTAASHVDIPSNSPRVVSPCILSLVMADIIAFCCKSMDGRAGSFVFFVCGHITLLRSPAQNLRLTVRQLDDQSGSTFWYALYLFADFILPIRFSTFLQFPMAKSITLCTRGGWNTAQCLPMSY